MQSSGETSLGLDVRKREQVTLVTAMLPSIGFGLFDDISVGGTPQHPFLHRFSALIAR